MAVRACYDDIANIFRAKNIEPKDSEINSILDRLEKQLKSRKSKVRSQADLDALMQRAVEIALDARKAAKITRQQRLIAAKREAELMQRIEASPIANKFNAYSDELVGSYRTFEGARDSADARGKSVHYSTMNGLLFEIEELGLDRIFTQGLVDRQIAVELHGNVDLSDADYKVKTGENRDPQAHQIAKLIKKYKDIMFERKRRNGVPIEYLEDHITRRVHDPLLMRKAGKDAWVQFLLEDRLDIDRTFGAVESESELKEILEETYTSLVSGVHLKADSDLTDAIASAKSPSNLARRMGQSRVLHFKDGNAAFDYYEQFTVGNLFEKVDQSFRIDSLQVALLEKLGPNPKAMHQRIMEKLELRHRGDDTVNVDRERSRIERQFAEIDGSVYGGGAGNTLILGGDLAQIASNVRMLQNMSNLGGAVISSISDIATKATFYQTYTDRNYLQSYYQSASDIFRGLNSKERKRSAYLLQAGVERYNGAIFARNGAEDGGPGLISKAHAMYYKANLLHPYTQSHKEGLTDILSVDLGRFAEIGGWDVVAPETKNLLSQFRLGEAEWPLFRSIVKKGANNKGYVYPFYLDEVPNDLLDKYIRDSVGDLAVTDRMRAEAIDELKTRLTMYLTDSMDTAVPTAGAREKAIMNMGQARGTALGEALRAFWNLKSFPLVMSTKIAGRVYHAKSSGKKIGGVDRGGILGLSQMMLGAGALGYLAIATKDIINGKEPRKPTGKVMAQAMLQGGGAGLYGDFLFGEFNRYGQSPLQTIAGPVIGNAADLITIFSGVRQGEPSATQAARFAIGNIPYINLFYTKWAVDYLFVYGAYEYTSPGFLRRMEKRVKKDYDQDFFYPPTQYAAQF